LGSVGSRDTYVGKDVLSVEDGLLVGNTDGSRVTDGDEDGLPPDGELIGNADGSRDTDGDEESVGTGVSFFFGWL